MSNLSSMYIVKYTQLDGDDSDTFEAVYTSIDNAIEAIMEVEAEEMQEIIDEDSDYSEGEGEMELKRAIKKLKKMINDKIEESPIKREEIKTLSFKTIETATAYYIIKVEVV